MYRPKATPNVTLMASKIVNKYHSVFYYSNFTNTSYYNVLLCYLTYDLVAIELISSQMYSKYGKCLILCSINSDDFIFHFHIIMRIRVYDINRFESKLLLGLKKNK